MLVTVGDIASEGTAIFDAIVVAANNTAHVGGNDRLADSEKVRAETTNEPLDEDLEDGSSDKRVQQTNGGVVHIPEAAGADLHNEEDKEGDEEGHESGGPDGNNLGAERVRKLRVDNLAVLEDDGEATARCRISHVDTETNGTHGGHGDNVESGRLEPLAKGGSAIVGWGSRRTMLWLSLSKDTLLLLVGVSASGCSGINCGRRVALLEETHDGFW